MSRMVAGRPRALLMLVLLSAIPSLTVAVAPSSVAAGTAAGAHPFSQTRTLTREFVSDTGTPFAVDTRTVTVKVDETSQLQGRERIHVSWSGAHPSAARASNPFGEAGLNQEYPVVIMQCRGLDDASLPVNQQLSPETCWTSTRMQRSQRVSGDDAIWTRDMYASAADRQTKSGITPYPEDDCQDHDPAAYAHVTQFRAAGGTAYVACTSEAMPPEAAVGASFPPAEQAAFTDLDGDGSTEFEVRSSVENESLGCSEQVACSLVVIPIMGLSCMAKDPAFATVDRNCRRAGQKLPGSSNFGNEGVDATVSPAYWWAASNWRNRFSVPLSFALPPGACDVLDSREPTPFFGSELLSQAALQWAPAYCLRKDRFKWQQNSMPDDAAFALMEQGEAAAATVSGGRPLSGSDPVGYAPTAVTGFAVSYVADKPGNDGEFTDLRLNARLLAKLLTESYPASGLGEGHPGIGANPRSINLDPEFQKLNPGLSDSPSEAAATLMALSTSSDVIKTLTSYISHDPQAMSFVNGHADRWGMKVNPFYKGITLPVAQWPLLDTYVPQTSLECFQQNPAPYLPQVAAPVGTMRQIASAVLDAWPLVQTRCDRAVPTDPWKLGRVDRQGMGTRLLLGITTLGDAARFGLRTARLQAKPGSYVGPTNAALSAAIGLAEQAQAMGPFTIDQSDVRHSAAAYPGTMVVYTAARTHGMKAADAEKVADFIEVSSTEGQVPGRGNGQLPQGYLPIKRTGPTSKLFDSAQLVARAVRAQKAVAGPAGQTQAPGSGAAGSGAAGQGQAASAAGVDALDASASQEGAAATSPVAKAAAAAGQASAAAQLPTVKTIPVSSRVGGFVLPLLLGLGVCGVVLSGAARLTLRGRKVR